MCLCVFVCACVSLCLSICVFVCLCVCVFVACMSDKQCTITSPGIKTVLRIAVFERVEQFSHTPPLFVCVRLSVSEGLCVFVWYERQGECLCVCVIVCVRVCVCISVCLRKSV